MTQNLLSLRGVARTVLTAVTLLLSSVVSAATSPVGATPGSFAVSPTGAATYTIPIAVPPGTAGMEPKLALSYNSQGGNGLVGMGWSLSGLPAITRCPQTVTQDGVKGGINFDANDRFCLDGQRLIAISGAYGAGGTEYRTEIESFSRIISYGTAGSGPAWFKVWTKSGQIIEFANTADSRIEAQGKASVMVWAVNKISDTAGNYLTVTYTEDNANGQYYPSQIGYTGNGTVVPYNLVQFAYTTRPDVTPLYVAGSMVKNTMRLMDIKTYIGATLVRDYSLIYDVSNLTIRSRLTNIIECAGDGTCLPQTAFSFTPTTNGIAYQGALVNNVESSTKFSTYFTDLNGDGKADLVQIPITDTSPTSVYVWLSNGNSFDWKGAWVNNAESSKKFQTYFVDLNGDGKSDLVQIPNSGAGTVSAYVWLSNGSGLVWSGAWATNLSSTGTFSTYFTDLNGDGKADLVQIPITDTSPTSVYVWLSNGSGFDWKGAWVNNAESSKKFQTYFVDLNGDGKSDLVQIPNSGAGTVSAYVWLSNGSGLVWSGAWATNLSSTGTFSTYFTDLNGDGKADLVQIPITDTSPTSVYVWLSNGSGFDWKGAWVNNAESSTKLQTYFVDLNGDGKSDLVQIPNSGAGTVSAYVWLSNGSGLVWSGAWATNLSSTGTFSTYFTDLNGDGKADLVQIPITDTSPTSVYVWQTDTRSVDSIATISTGLGVATALTYKPLTDNSVYTKGSGAAYPVLDLQAPIYVVTQASSSNGIGGTFDTDYTYGGAKVDLSGRGFLGFGWQQAINSGTNMAGYTEYAQSFPYIGMPTKATIKLGAQLLKQTSNTPATYGPAPYAGIKFPYISQSIETASDLNGAALPTVTTSTTYDAYGNPLSITVSTGDGYSKTTTNTYDNTIDASHWFLGRLKRSTVTSTTP